MTTVQLPLTASQRDRAQSELLEHLRQATLGEYDIVGELGRGGMATVYLAHDIALDRQVAIKVMNPGLMMGEGTHDRFKREARTAAALTHPHIIPIHLVRETDRVVFFVMKYVQGRGLDSIIFERGPLPIRMAQAILTVEAPTSLLTLRPDCPSALGVGGAGAAVALLAGKRNPNPTTGGITFTFPGP